ncbi:MAG: type II toxin-antitoxin system PemK/MazF family toxin [Bacteroidota bacterium]
MKKRGEIWWVNFDPAIGQEIKKKRPAIIISNNKSNKYLKRYQVVPCSSKTNKIYPSEAVIKINGQENKAMADQIMTVSEIRFLNKIGKLSKEDIVEIERVVKFQIDIKDTEK